jgi:hypothetical protein
VCLAYVVGVVDNDIIQIPRVKHTDNEREV